MQIADKQIIKKKTFNCSLDKAWYKWTTHEGLLTFFGRDNKIELKPGGTLEIYFLMDNPYGLRGSEKCKVLAFKTKKMFSFTWNSPPHFKEVRESDYFTRVVINFKEVSPAATEISLQHLDWPDDKKWEPVYEYFEYAWDSVFDSFDRSLSKKND